MFTKTGLSLLASAILAANGANAAAANHHRHADLHKREIVPETTQTVYDVTWTTVFVQPGEEAPAATPTTPVVVASSAIPSSASQAPTTSSSSSSVVSSSTSIVSSTTPVTTSTTPSATPTTLATSVVASSFAAPNADLAETTSTTSTSADLIASITSDVAAVVTSAAAVVSSAAAAVSSAVSSSSGCSGKRIAAYNTPSLITPLIGDGTQICFAYNWDSDSGGLSDVSTSLSYVPMLWSNLADHTDSWASNIEAAIEAGSTYAVAFNEPDNAGQADMSAATAAEAYQTYMNPYCDQISCGAPAITNSNTAGESTDWLTAWVEACDGACTYDFCPAHWYNYMSAGTDDLIDFVGRVSAACGTDKKVWITEFETLDGSDDEKAEFLSTIQSYFDSNDTIGAYAWFMVEDGNLVSGSSTLSYGNTFAYST